MELYHDLPLPGSRQVIDLFTHFRPDIAIKSPSKIGILELTICHETNFMTSRNYKLDKYKHISNHRSTLIKTIPVKVYTCEISVSGFVILEPQFLSDFNLQPLDNKTVNNLAMSTIMSSFEIYCERNT